MSRRRNGTNRVQAGLNVSRYTGYGKPRKKAVTLAEVNDRLNKNIHFNYTGQQEKMQDKK